MSEAPKQTRMTVEDRAERMCDALHRIKQWADAYPTDIFPPVDLKAAREQLGDDALFARLHAEWARHILGGIRRYVDAGLS